MLGAQGVKGGGTRGHEMAQSVILNSSCSNYGIKSNAVLPVLQGCKAYIPCEKAAQICPKTDCCSAAHLLVLPLHDSQTRIIAERSIRLTGVIG